MKTEESAQDEGEVQMPYQNNELFDELKLKLDNINVWIREIHERIKVVVSNSKAIAELEQDLVSLKEKV